MIVKSTLVALVMVAFLASLAVAQEGQPVARIVTEERQPAPRFVIGWNAINPALCFLASSGTTYVRGTDNSLWALLSPGSATLVSPACPAGTPIWFHVTDLFGSVDGIATFPR